MKRIFVLAIILSFGLQSKAQKQSLPLNENFNASSDDLPTGWTRETATYNWEIEDWGIDGTNAITYAYSGSQAKTGWFFTPSLDLTAGKTYFIEFMMRAPGYLGSVESLRLKVGMGASSADMTELIWENENIADGVFKRYLFPFTANSTAGYNFGWQAFSPAGQDFISIDNISIIEAPELDISIRKIMLPDAEVLGNSPNSKLVVQNLSNDTKTFDVELVITEDGNLIHSETVNVSNLEVADTQEVTFSDFIPTYEAIYTYTYNVSATGVDANTSDNQLVKAVPFIAGCEHRIELSTTMQPMGWLGAYITIKSDGLDVLIAKTLENGNYVEYTFPSSEGANINIDFDNEGEFQTNCHWEVFDGENNSLIAETGTTSGEHIIQDVTGNCAPVYINNLKNNEINIYPNPSSGIVNISLGNNYQLSISDILGNEIKNINVSNNSVINIKEKGVFFLKFKNKDKTYIKKIIIK